MAKRGGNLHQTRIRKIDGRIGDLRDELQMALGLKDEQIAINQTTRHIIIKVAGALFKRSSATHMLTVTHTGLEEGGSRQVSRREKVLSGRYEDLPGRPVHTMAYSVLLFVGVIYRSLFVHYALYTSGVSNQ